MSFHFFGQIWWFWYSDVSIFPFFLRRKKQKERSKIERLNIKTIRFDKKKWKDNLVLHYLISKWIFFLITFRRHQDLQILISPKSLILQTKKFLQNDARIQKRLKRLGFCRKVWLTQRQLFIAFDNKSLTFKCSSNDVRTTFSSKMLKDLKEQGFCRKV